MNLIAQIATIKAYISSPLKPNTKHAKYVLTDEGERALSVYLTTLMQDDSILLDYSTNCGLTKDIVQLTFKNTDHNNVDVVLNKIKTQLEQHPNWFK